MATTAKITIAAPPSTEETALTLLQWLYASSGVLTDATIGSITRTFGEGIGSVDEIEAISIQAEAYQALIYSGFSAFNISPFAATSSVGTVAFSTIDGSPLPVINVPIPLNTILQTPAGVQFVTTSSSILASGQISVIVPVQSVATGTNTNAGANTINLNISGLSYPLVVTNPLPTAGGADAETPSQTMARFTAYVQSLGLCSPVAIAGGVVGVPFGQEIVRYSTVFEKWIQNVEFLDLPPIVGFEVIIDNGSGFASPGLLSAVNTYLSTGYTDNNGVKHLTGGVGLRPAGVPYTVSYTTVISADVSVVATAIDPNSAGILSTSITQAVSGYFGLLNYGDPAEVTQIIASIANVSFSQLSSLAVSLFLTGDPTEVDVLVSIGPTPAGSPQPPLADGIGPGPDGEPGRVLLVNNSVVVT